MNETKREGRLPILAIVLVAWLAVGVTAVGLTVAGRQPAEEFLDPRGPERGPDDLEWQVIQTYKAIESMTASEPSREVVDRTLSELRDFANHHPENPYIQELYLKGLRVAAYYSEESGLEARTEALQARFLEHAAQFMSYEMVVLESIRLRIQRLGQSCDDHAFEAAAIRVLALRFPESEEIATALSSGLETESERCGGFR